MAKTQEELNAIKEDVETLNNKLTELTEEELTQVTGGINDSIPDFNSVQEFEKWVEEHKVQ